MRGLAAIAAFSLLAASCAVGPDFHRPSPPRTDSYGEASASREAAESHTALALGEPTDPQWWRLFGSPRLDALESRSLRDSPSLASARAALEQARDQQRAGAGLFFPGLSGSFDAQSERSSPARLGQPGSASTFSLYTLTGSVSYAIDLFGGERRGVEALGAAADRQRHALGAANLLLTGGVADAAIARAAYADEVGVLEAIVAQDAAERDIEDAGYRAGHAAYASVLAADQQLAADRQALAAARLRLAAAGDLLKALLGAEPGEVAPPAPALDDLAAPLRLPVSLPSQIVRQRPDILQAEAGLHQASAAVGVATAALFPQITLTGDYGAATSQLSRLSAPAGRFWSIGPAIQAPLFQGGSLWFSRKAAQAGYRRAEADYRQTVLTALQQVSDSLYALQADETGLDAAAAAFAAASQARQLAEANREAGVASDADAIAARIAEGRARLQWIAARAQRLQDLAALSLACGGGWTADTTAETASSQ